MNLTLSAKRAIMAFALTTSPAFAGETPTNEVRSLIPPEPANNGRYWVLPSDYPTRELKEDLSAFVDVELTIDDKGNILECRTTKVEGKEVFEELTCSVFRKRAEFKPARDANGNAHFGVYRTSTDYTTGNAVYGPKPIHHNMALKLAALPEGLTAPATVKLALAVDTKGKAFACDRMDEDDNAQLLSIACDQAMKAAWTVVTTPDGASNLRSRTRHSCF
jgi:hypothetical protein